MVLYNIMAPKRQKIINLKLNELIPIIFIELLGVKITIMGHHQIKQLIRSNIDGNELANDNSEKW